MVSVLSKFPSSKLSHYDVAYIPVVIVYLFVISFSVSSLLYRISGGYNVITEADTLG